MRLHKRIGDGGGGPGVQAVLGAVGLGAFARLALPDNQPEELGLVAAYDGSSGRILVSLPGGAVSASSADLADALELPRGPFGLAAGVDADAAVFSSAEAIAAVSRFVRDRVILCGGGGEGAPASGEVAAALRLVEEGRGYEVDWGALVWSVVKGEVVAGTPRRYAPYLLHLMERRRPELFTGVGMQLDSEYLDLEAEDVSLVYGGSQDIGDLEDMPIFGEGKKETLVGREEIPELSQGNAEHGSRNILHSDVSLLGHKMEFDCREGSYRQSSSKKGGYFSQQQAIYNYQSLSPFQACMQQIRGYVPAMEGGYLDIEKDCRDTRDEVESIKKMVMEKNHLYDATVSDIKEELGAWSTVLSAHEANKDLMYSTMQNHAKLLKKTQADFKEYMNRIMRGEGAESNSEVLGISGGHNYARLQQVHQYHCKKIISIDQTGHSNSLKLEEKITELDRVIADLNHEVQRLKNAGSIPDLNNGVEDDCEGEASLGKPVDRSSAGEGCHVSNIAQGGQQLDELFRNPDQRNITGESMDLNGAQRCNSEDEACHGGAASQGTS